MAREIRGGNRPQIGMCWRARFARVDLVGERKLLHCDLVLVRVSGPGAVHQAVGLVFLVFREHAQRTFVQLGVSAARIQRGHAADREDAVLVASLSQQLTEILKERHVVRNRVSIGKNPLRIFEVEVDEAGHVIPAPEIQADDVIAQVINELLHLVRQRMRLRFRNVKTERMPQAIEVRLIRHGGDVEQRR